VAAADDDPALNSSHPPGATPSRRARWPREALVEIAMRQLGGGVAILHVVGRLNMASAPRLGETASAALAQGDTRLAIDLGEVTFLDSSGLGAIVNIVKKARHAGGDVRVAAPSAQVRLVFQLTNMDQAIVICDDAEKAFARRSTTTSPS
jgi:anti-sigma B factor antagonist